MKIVIINGLLSTAYIVLSFVLLGLITWANNAVGMRVGPRKDAPSFHVLAGNTIQHVTPEAAFGGMMLLAMAIGGAIGWFLPEIWLVEGRETWIDRAAQVIGCLCWIAIGYRSLGWVYSLAVVGFVVFAIGGLGYAALTYVFPSIGAKDLSDYAQPKDRRDFITRWREQRLVDEAMEQKEETAAALKKGMAPFIGKWVAKDKQGRIVGGLSIDKDGVEELDSKGNQTWGMVADWTYNGAYLITTRAGQAKRAYHFPDGPDVLEQWIYLDGRFDIARQKFEKVMP